MSESTGGSEQIRDTWLKIENWSKNGAKIKEKSIKKSMHEMMQTWHQKGTPKWISAAQARAYK